MRWLRSVREGVIPAKAGIAVNGWHLRLLIPAASGLTEMKLERGGYTYFITNKPRGVLYIGATSDIAERMMQYRAGIGSAFARKYGLNRLVLIEHHSTVDEAIAREKAMKAWKRDWKIVLIEQGNPGWNDLFEALNS